MKLRPTCANTRHYPSLPVVMSLGTYSKLTDTASPYLRMHLCLSRSSARCHSNPCGHGVVKYEATTNSRHWRYDIKSKSACNSTYSVAKLHWCLNTPDFSSLMSLLETTLQRHMLYTESQTQLQRHDTYRSRVTNTVHRRRNPVRIVGTPVSMRMDKVGGAMQNCGQVDRV